MAQQFALHHDAPAYNPRYTDAFVVFSVTVLSLAIGVWCLMRLDMALWSGAVAALAVYTVLLSFHLMVRRSLVAADHAPAERDQGDVWMRASHMPETGEEPAGDVPRSPSEEIERWTQAARSDEKERKEELPTPAASDPFSFRPLQEPSLPHRAGDAERASLSSTPQSGAREPRLPQAAQPEMSVELIQDLIKKLADELNTTPAVVEKAAATASAVAPAPAATSSTLRTMPGPHAHFEAAPGPVVQPPVSGGVASWWPVAEPAGGGIGAPAPRSPSAPPALNPRLAPIAEAVAAERMEVLLEPIHVLAEGRPRHFEVSTRLLTVDGTPIDQGEVARVAQGSGLMPRIDAARMVRAARVARKLGERGRQGSVLAAVAGESLTDERFLDAAASEPGPEGGMSLVLAFTQSEVRNFTPGHAEALGALAAAGFAFALEEVTDLEMDFAQLKEMGFAFVELDAPVFLDGLPAPGGRVPASDICRHLSEFGLTLIVGSIEDDWLLARILGFGVVFGKGMLFGAPRLVKDEVVAAPTSA